MCSNITEYFKALPALYFVKVMFLVMSKMVSPNKQNLVIFRTEIGLKVIFWAKCFSGRDIKQYSKRKTKQYSHTKTHISFFFYVHA